jgi:hypothetical protein
MERGRLLFLAWLLALAAFCLSGRDALADGRMSTYLEGKITRKTTTQWVLVAADGTYWISLERPPSWRRNLSAGRISFWIPLQQITRYRPAARPEPPKEYSRPSRETEVAGTSCHQPIAIANTDPRQYPSTGSKSFDP